MQPLETHRTRHMGLTGIGRSFQTWMTTEIQHVTTDICDVSRSKINISSCSCLHGTDRGNAGGTVSRLSWTRARTSCQSDSGPEGHGHWSWYSFKGKCIRKTPLQSHRQHTNYHISLTQRLTTGTTIELFTSVTTSTSNINAQDK